MARQKKISRPRKRRQLHAKAARGPAGQIRKRKDVTVAKAPASQPKPNRGSSRRRLTVVPALPEICAVSPEAHNLAS